MNISYYTFPVDIGAEKLCCVMEILLLRNQRPESYQFDLGQVMISVVLNSHVCQVQLTCLSHGVVGEDSKTKSNRDTSNYFLNR